MAKVQKALVMKSELLVMVVLVGWLYGNDISILFHAQHAQLFPDLRVEYPFLLDCIDGIDQCLVFDGHGVVVQVITIVAW